MAAAAPLVGQMVGSSIGSSFGMPGVGALIGGAIGQMFAPKQIIGKLSDTRVTSQAYGNAIPWCFNTYRASHQIIWAVDLAMGTQDVGKGGKGPQEAVYFATFAAALCKGPATGISRIWADGKLIYDGSPLFSTNTNSGLYRVDSYVQNSGGYVVQANPPTQDFTDLSDALNYWKAMVAMRYNANAHGGNTIAAIENIYIDPYPAGFLWNAAPSGSNTSNIPNPGYLGVQLDLEMEYVQGSNGNTVTAPDPYQTKIQFVRTGSGLVDQSTIVNNLYLNDLGKTVAMWCWPGVAVVNNSYATAPGYTYDRNTQWQVWPNFVFPSSSIQPNNVGVYAMSPSGPVAAPQLSSDGGMQLTPNIRFYPGSETQMPNSTMQSYLGAANTTAFRGLAYVVYDGFPIQSYGNRIPNLEYEIVRYKPSSVPLQPTTYAPYTAGDIFAEVSAQVGLPAAKLDTSLATAVPQGFWLSTRTAARDALQNILTVFAIDTVETDGVLRLIPRAKAPYYGVIPFDDLGVQKPGNSVLQPVNVTRIQDVDLPALVEVNFPDPNFPDPNRAYMQNIANAKNQLATSNNITSYTFPVVMPFPLAAAVAELLLDGQWYARRTYQFQVGMRYMDLDPGDVVDVETENGVRRMIVTKLTVSVDGVIAVQAQLFDYGIYGNLAAIPTVVPVNQAPITPIANPRLVMLDIPLLSDNDNASGAYVAVYPDNQSSQWKGAALYEVDGANNYVQVASISTVATVGAATTALANCGNPAIWDNANSVTVKLAIGAVFANAKADVIDRGAGLALLGNEIVAFSNVTPLSDGVSYVLSGLLRGRKGTEWATGTHVTGETFVLLDANVVRVPLAVQRMGVPMTYGTVAPGLGLSNAASTSFTNTNAGLRCYSPVQLVQSGQTVTWTRRDRLADYWAPYVDAPLSEQNESYTVSVISTTGQSVTSYQVQSPSFTYTLAQATADFAKARLGAPTQCVLQIAQNSTVTGPGFTSSITITLS
ncbi:phage tail protein [Burkholderia pseudomallei]|uniref:phage tail protein n=1 Tax=Burkholderia pseudomallei TaxID=28450 RepID=UPI00193CCA24|nr:phage tail protein [Burkholderia pseudomallei]QRM23512.1 phage tail protein [Burkholderia pseudomallei]